MDKWSDAERQETRAKKNGNKSSVHRCVFLLLLQLKTNSSGQRPRMHLLTDAALIPVSNIDNSFYANLLCDSEKHCALRCFDFYHTCGTLLTKL